MLHRRGILDADFIDKEQSIIIVWCITLQKLRMAIKNKRSGLLISGIVMLHEDVRTTYTLFRKRAFKRQLFSHPLASPKLAQIDFHTFL